MQIDRTQIQETHGSGANRVAGGKRIAMGAVVYSALCVVLLVALPNGMFRQSLAGLLAMGAVAAAAYRCTTWQSAGGWAVLGVGASMAAALISVNWYYFSTVGGTGLDNPGLVFDPGRAWNSALTLAGYTDGTPADSVFLGYNSVVWACIEVFGRSVIAPMILNGMAMLLGGLFTGSLAARLIPCSQGRAHAGMWGMIMIFAISAFTYTSAILIKDALLCMCVPAFARGLVDIRRPKWLATAMIAAATITWVRTSMAAMLVPGVLMMLSCIGARRNWWRVTAILVAIAGMYAVERMMTMGIAVENIPDANINYIIDIQSNGNQDVWLSFLDSHGEWQLWQNILVLPASILVQFLIPFPWNLDSAGCFMGYASIYYRFAYPWYFIGGLILYYIAKGWLRSAPPLKHLFLWAVCCWVAPAFMLGGTVSRYGTPFAPILCLGAVYVVLNFAHGKGLWKWMGVFCVLMAIGLAACYLIMKHYVATH